MISLFCNLFSNMSSTFPRIFLTCYFFCLCSLLLIFFICIFNILIYLKELFYDVFDAQKIVTYTNNYYEKVQYMQILQTFKIKNMFITVLKIFVYALPNMLFFVVLRILNFDKVLDLNVVLNNFKVLPLSLQLLLLLLGVFYILILKLLFYNINIRLYFECKKLYIYSYNYGSLLDKNCFIYYPDELCKSFRNILYTKSYLNLFVVKLITKISPYTLKLNIYRNFNLSKKILIFKLQKDTFSIIFFMLPYIYFYDWLRNKYLFIVNFIETVAKIISQKLHEFLVIIGWLLFIIIMLQKVYYDNFVLTNYFKYILLFYAYNQYINLCTFLWKTSEYAVFELCMYYYHINNLKTYPKDVYLLIKNLLNICTTNINNKTLIIFVFTGLDMIKTGQLLNNDIKKTIIEDLFAKITQRLYSLRILKVIITLNETFFKITQQTIDKNTFDKLKKKN